MYVFNTDWYLSHLAHHVKSRFLVLPLTTPSEIIFWQNCFKQCMQVACPAYLIISVGTKKVNHFPRPCTVTCWYLTRPINLLCNCPPNPSIKVILTCLLPLHARWKWRLKQRPEEMVLRQVWEKSEFATRGPSKLTKQPNKRKNRCSHY